LPTKVLVADQVREYQRRLAPEPRHKLKAAILALPVGDTRALTDELDGLHRLRVGQHRVIYRDGGQSIECIFAEERKIVYEYLAAHVSELLR
jgi:mRNA-degrading endonuclease RelE of RelBE toxin-antitoxin system